MLGIWQNLNPPVIIIREELLMWQIYTLIKLINDLFSSFFFLLLCRFFLWFFRENYAFVFSIEFPDAFKLMMVTRSAWTYGSSYRISSLLCKIFFWWAQWRWNRILRRLLLLYHFIILSPMVSRLGLSLDLQSLKLLHHPPLPLRLHRSRHDTLWVLSERGDVRVELFQLHVEIPVLLWRDIGV